MATPPIPASVMPMRATLAACEPGFGTLKTKIPTETLTSRLNWAMVKPTPVPTRDQRQQRHVADRKSSPAPSCTAVPLGVSLAGPPPVMTSAVPATTIPSVESRRPAATRPTVPVQSSYPKATPLRTPRGGHGAGRGGRRN